MAEQEAQDVNQYKVTRFGQPAGVTNVTVGDYFVYTGHGDDFTLCSEPCYDQNQEWQEEGVACVASDLGPGPAR